MRDHNFIRKGDCLIDDVDGYTEPVTAFMDRLRIELLIRELRL